MERLRGSQHRADQLAHLSVDIIDVGKPHKIVGVQLSGPPSSTIEHEKKGSCGPVRLEQGLTSTMAGAELRGGRRREYIGVPGRGALDDVHCIAGGGPA